jgi:hypothetical protein
MIRHNSAKCKSPLKKGLFLFCGPRKSRWILWQIDVLPLSVSISVHPWQTAFQYSFPNFPLVLMRRLCQNRTRERRRTTDNRLPPAKERPYSWVSGTMMVTVKIRPPIGSAEAVL